MVSNSKLEELKKQVRNTSDQQLQIRGRRDRSQEIVSDRERKQEQNQKEMVQIVRNVFGQSELVCSERKKTITR